MKKEPEESAWETGADGKRYRRIGNTLEYEMEVFVNGCYVPESQAESFRAEAESAEKLRKEALKKANNRPELKICPFSDGMNNNCKREKCHLFVNGRCAIAIIADTSGAKQTDDKPTQGTCPFSIYGQCKDCALNIGGCGFVRLAKAKYNEKIESEETNNEQI